MNEVINGIFNRRSIRAYKPISVEQEKLDIILQAALCGPTAMNRQQTHFAVLLHRGDGHARIRRQTAFPRK